MPKSNTTNRSFGPKLRKGWQLSKQNIKELVKSRVDRFGDPVSDEDLKELKGLLKNFTKGLGPLLDKLDKAVDKNDVGAILACVKKGKVTIKKYMVAERKVKSVAMPSTVINCLTSMWDRLCQVQRELYA